MGQDAMILVFIMLSFKSAFSLSSFTFIKRLFSCFHLLSLEWYHLYIWGCCYFSLQSWFQPVIHPAWQFAWCTLRISYISRVTIYSLDVLLSRFWIGPLFHVQFLTVALIFASFIKWTGKVLGMVKGFLKPPFWSCKDYLCKARTALIFLPFPKELGGLPNKDWHVYPLMLKNVTPPPPA